MDLFYYTSTDTLRFVLTKGDIYATNIRYMNDSEEYINGLQELYKISKDTQLVGRWMKKKGLDANWRDKMQAVFSEENLTENMQKMEYYSISFCKKNDLLSQWAIYAKESGVSIKMKFEKEYYRFLTKSTEDKVMAEWNLLPREVFYFTLDSMKKKKVKYNDVAYAILDQLYSDNSKDQEEWKKERWRYVSTLVKRYDFYQEEECRLVFEPNESAYEPLVQYRPDKKVLKPYLDIECEGGWPIWEIMIGPGFNQQVVFESIEHFLNYAKIKAGCDDTKEYVKRIKSYLLPWKKELEKCKEYKELQKIFSNRAWTRSVDLEDAKIFLQLKIREIMKTINKDSEYSEDLKNYFNECRFTRSGIVLKKSSIPYIF